MGKEVNPGHDLSNYVILTNHTLLIRQAKQGLKPIKAPQVPVTSFLRIHSPMGGDLGKMCWTSGTSVSPIGAVRLLSSRPFQKIHTKKGIE